jgi:hypothetical protein
MNNGIFTTTTDEDLTIMERERDPIMWASEPAPFDYNLAEMERCPTASYGGLSEVVKTR